MNELLLRDHLIAGRSLWCERHLVATSAVRITIDNEGPPPRRATVMLTRPQQAQLRESLGCQSANAPSAPSAAWVPIPVDLLRALAEALERPRDPEGAKLCAKRVVAAYRAAVEPPDLRAAREALTKAGYAVNFPPPSPEGVP